MHPIRLAAVTLAVMLAGCTSSHPPADAEVMPLKPDGATPIFFVGNNEGGDWTIRVWVESFTSDGIQSGSVQTLYVPRSSGDSDRLYPMNRDPPCLEPGDWGRDLYAEGWKGAAASGPSSFTIKQRSPWCNDPDRGYIIAIDDAGEAKWTTWEAPPGYRRGDPYPR